MAASVQSLEGSFFFLSVEIRSDRWADQVNYHHRKSLAQEGVDSMNSEFSVVGTVIEVMVMF
jgi:hypothetical protein